MQRQRRHRHGEPGREARSEWGETILQQQAWQTALLNAPNYWVEVGLPYNPAGYFKDSMGVVHLRGSINGGLNEIFALPTGYGPAFREIHAVYGGDGISFCRISPSGVVEHTSGPMFSCPWMALLLGPINSSNVNWTEQRTFTVW